MKSALLSFCGLLVCCSELSYVDGKYPPTSPSHIEVVSLGQLQKPYEIIGEITGNPVLQKFSAWKERAAALGGDAMSIPQMLPNRYVKIYVIKWK